MSKYVDGSRFTWGGPGRKHGMADASDLGFKAGMVPYTQVYQDAADLGLTLIGKTRNVEFILTKVKECDDELVAWEFESICGEFTICIIND